MEFIQVYVQAGAWSHYWSLWASATQQGLFKHTAPHIIAAICCDWPVSTSPQLQSKPYVWREISLILARWFKCCCLFCNTISMVHLLCKHTVYFTHLVCCNSWWLCFGVNYSWLCYHAFVFQYYILRNLKSKGFFDKTFSLFSDCHLCVN